MRPYYYVAICVIKQTGGDNDIGMVREISSMETVTAPQSLEVVSAASSANIVTLIGAARQV